MLAGVAYALAAGALWGFVFLAARILTNYSAADIALGRFIACGAVSLAILAMRPGFLRKIMTVKIAFQALALACLSYSLYFLALAESVKLAGVVPATLIVGLLPVSIPLCGHEKIANRKWFYVSLVLIVFGLALLDASLFSARSVLADMTTPQWGIGVVLAILALALWTAYALLNARFLARHADMDSSTWASLQGVGALLTIIPVWIFLMPAQGISERFFEMRYILWMLGTGIGGSWLASLFWNMASRQLSAALTGQLIVSETLFSLLYSYIYDHRLPSLSEGGAAFLLVSGVLLGIRAFSKPRGVAV